MGRFDLFWNGLKGMLAGLGVLAVCLSQVIFGWIGDELWLRIVYGAAGLLLGAPMIVVGFMYAYMGLTGDVDTRMPPRIYRRN
ncbi:hypothetical protein Pan97_01800 [Bremerella volcania]|uniref:Uncharacterized protein n=1 Tax=Bremerella volcania TaxID=2527984 RepID=A0A518C1W7_9BACT|nr:hypothetical protein [Bremerella volcania]QDU73213.1 hypothetical protein Pan97_01800 [Bremerella volcania]